MIAEEEFIVGETDVPSWEAKDYVSTDLVTEFENIFEGVPQSKQSGLFYHYAVYFNNTQFEITGDEKNFVREEITSATHFKNTHKTLTSMVVPSNSSVNSEVIKRYMEKWVKRHPKYTIGYANCQKFAKDVAYDLFGLKIFTQTDRYRLYGIIFLVFTIFVAVVILFTGVKYSFYLMEQGKILDERNQLNASKKI
jgi:hypothetical protein